MIREAPTYTEYQGDDYLTPTVLLRIFKEVLALAVRDAMNKGRSWQHTTNRADARAWLLSQEAAEVCEAIGLDAKALKIWVEQGCKKPGRKQYAIDNNR